MVLEKVIYVSRKEAEKGLDILRNGLPEGAEPVQGNEFSGYYFLIKRVGKEKIKLVYEPFTEKGDFLFRNAFYLE